MPVTGAPEMFRDKSGQVCGNWGRAREMEMNTCPEEMDAEMNFRRTD